MGERKTYVGNYLIASWTPATKQDGIDRFNEIIAVDIELSRLVAELEAIPFEARWHNKEVERLSGRIERITNAAERKAFGKVQH